jgi:N-acetylmuramoyl-L-alanine amidase
MYIAYHPSPNHEDRIGVAEPTLVILHYTGMKDAEAALERLCDPQSKVSAHYLVDEDGKIFHMVDEERRAWHAGKSKWKDIEDINSHSIGIEIVNPGHELGYRAFPEAQMRAVLALCKDIKKRCRLPPAAFLGHSDVAPARKQDPGELFDWKMLAEQGIGLWPEVADADHAPLSKEEAEKLLAAIGYDMSQDFSAVLLAFQRHYHPENLSGNLDEGTAACIRALNRVSA